MGGKPKINTSDTAPPPPPPPPQRAKASETLLTDSIRLAAPQVGAEPSVITKALTSRSSSQRKRNLGAG